MCCARSSIGRHTLVHMSMLAWLHRRALRGGNRRLRVVAVHEQRHVSRPRRHVRVRVSVQLPRQELPGPRRVVLVARDSLRSEQHASVYTHSEWCQVRLFAAFHGTQVRDTGELLRGVQSVSIGRVRASRRREERRLRVSKLHGRLWRKELQRAYQLLQGAESLQERWCLLCQT